MEQEEYMCSVPRHQDVRLHRKPYIARGPARNMLAFLVKTLEDLYIPHYAIQNLVLIIADGTKTNTET